MTGHFELGHLFGQAKILVALLYISLGIIVHMLYLPCLYALFKLITKERRTSSCYKLMLYLGLVDCMGVSASGYCGGIASWRGDVYCQSPIFVYSFCTLGMLAWCAGNCNTILLSINRCMVIYDADMADRWFRGHRTLIWLCAPTFASLFFIFITPPVAFNSIDSSALFNPHMHYLPSDEDFHSRYHHVHVLFNWFIVFAILGIYTIFCVSFGRKLCYSGYNKKLLKEINTFLQVLITCAFVVFSSLGFIYQQYLKSVPVYVYASLIFYQGSPAIIYLCMNQSIRNIIFGRGYKARKASILPSVMHRVSIMDKLDNTR
uniref:Uncharacterized protein n=1 Tax=Ditylenchus dipsaci TaxID=166011 RepID=A0A915DST6_9BILA